MTGVAHGAKSQLGGVRDTHEPSGHARASVIHTKKESSTTNAGVKSSNEASSDGVSCVSGGLFVGSCGFARVSEMARTIEDNERRHGTRRRRCMCPLAW